MKADHLSTKLLITISCSLAGGLNLVLLPSNYHEFVGSPSEECKTIIGGRDS